MIRIDTNSWHFRWLYDWTSGKLPGDATSICEYTRTIVGHLLVILILGTIVLVVVTFGSLMIVEWFAALFNLIFTGNYIPVVQPWLLAMGFVDGSPYSLLIGGWVCLALLSVAVIGLNWSTIMEKLKIATNDVGKGDGMGAIIKARYDGWKNKYCPVVEFFDGEK